MKSTDERYHTCPCGEYRRSAIKKGRCHHCRSRKRGCGTCVVCGRQGVPVQKHHVGLKEHNPSVTEWLCRNCHPVITAQQQRHWPDNLTSESYLTLGWVTLWQMARPFGRCDVIEQHAGDALREVRYVQTS